MALTFVKQAPRLITSVKSLAERLAATRLELKLSQARLAELAKVSPGAIGNLEAGTRSQPRNLLAIAKALGVRAEWLADGVGEKWAHGEKPVAGHTPLIAAEPSAPEYNARQFSASDWALLQDVKVLPEDRQNEIRAEATRWRTLTDKIIEQRIASGDIAKVKPLASAEVRPITARDIHRPGLRKSTEQKGRERTTKKGKT